MIIVASVSAIYGLGSPETYSKQLLSVGVGEEHAQRAILGRLVDLQYERNDMGFVRNKFRVRGDTIEIYPAYEERAVRVSLFGDEIEKISWVDPLTGEIAEDVDRLVLFPASHYVTDHESLARATVGHRAGAARAAQVVRGATASCSRRSACGCAPPTTSRCCARSAPARASRTTRATSTAGSPARRRTRCSTTSPTTTSWCSTSRT